MNEEYFSIDVNNGLYDKLKSLEHSLTQNSTSVDSTTDCDNYVTKFNNSDHDRYTRKELENQSMLDDSVNEHQNDREPNHNGVSDSQNNLTETISIEVDDESNGLSEIIQISDDSLSDESWGCSNSTAEFSAELSYSTDEERENAKMDAIKTSGKTIENSVSASEITSELLEVSEKKDDTTASEKTNKSSETSETTNENEIQPSKETSTSSDASKTTNENDIEPPEEMNKSSDASKTTNENDIEPSEEMNKSSDAIETTKECNIQLSEETSKSSDVLETTNENDIQPLEGTNTSSYTSEIMKEIQTSDETNTSSDVLEIANKINIQASDETESSDTARIANKVIQPSEETVNLSDMAEIMNEIDIQSSEKTSESSETVEKRNESDSPVSEETSKPIETTNKKINENDVRIVEETSKPCEIPKRMKITVAAFAKTTKSFEITDEAIANDDHAFKERSNLVPAASVASTEDSEVVSAEVFQEIIEIDDDTDSTTDCGICLPETKNSNVNPRSSQEPDVQALKSNANSNGKVADYRCSLSDQSDNESVLDSPENKVKISPSKIKQSPGKIKSNRKVKHSPGKIKRSPKWRPQINGITSMIKEPKENIAKQLNSSDFISECSIKNEDFKIDKYKNPDAMNNKDVNSSKIDKQFKLLDVIVRLPKIDYPAIKREQADRSNQLGHSISLSKFREVEAKYFQTKAELYSDNLSLDAGNNGRCRLLNQKRKENIRKRKSARFSRISRGKFKKEKKCANKKTEKNVTNIKVKRYLTDRRSLRLLGKTPIEYDLPLPGRVVKNGVNRLKSVKELTSGVKRSLSPHKENVNTKQIKTIKDIKKPVKISSTARKRVTFVLDKKDSPTKILRNGKDQAYGSCENKSSNIENNELDSDKNIKNTDSHSNIVSVAKPQSKIPLLPIRNYQKTVDVWYECDCCHQKYLLLEHIKQHVRGHFPNDLTS